MLNLAIGQGELLVTPLQLAVYYGVLGTRGNLVSPHVLDRVETWDGKPVETYQRKSHVVPITPESLRFLREALTQVVERGTGRGSKLEGIQVSGKTGTAQNPHGTEHAWFVAYGPADAPEIVVAVLVEQGGHGGATAAPIAKRIFEGQFGTTIAMTEEEEAR
jgi:cell division protein FtsI/penicillin-binding protein 2